MVAKPSAIADPFPLPAEWVAARRNAQLLLTIKDVQTMVKVGIVPEDASTELLHGVLVYTDRAATSDAPVDPRTYVERFDLKGSRILEGADHNYVVSGLAELATSINSPLRHLRTQSTLVCSETHAPIPDAVILRGPRTNYRGQRPTAADAHCVIEVADSSYDHDAGEKLFGNACAGIQQYIILNLRNRTAEVYTHPDVAAGTYPPPQIISVEGTLLLRVGETETFAVAMRDILP
jgi:Uma2 family endonuclease